MVEVKLATLIYYSCVSCFPTIIRIAVGQTHLSFYRRLGDPDVSYFIRRGHQSIRYMKLMSIK